MELGLNVDLFPVTPFLEGEGGRIQEGRHMCSCVRRQASGWRGEQGMEALLEGSAPRPHPASALGGQMWQLWSSAK